MTSVIKSVDLPYSAAEMFELVSDVRRYPEFVKWLQSLRISNETASESAWKGRAEAAVGFKGFSERFTTDVDARRNDLAVDVSLVKGPFRRLVSRWRIKATPNGSRIEFAIDFEFRNLVLQALARANLDLAVRRLMESFVSEAARRYGQRLHDQAP